MPGQGRLPHSPPRISGRPRLGPARGETPGAASQSGGPAQTASTCPES